MPYKPYGIIYRSYLSRRARLDGYAFMKMPNTPSIRPHVGEFLDQAVFSCSQEHVVGTKAQFDNGLASIYHSPSDGGFVGFTALTRKTNPGRDIVITFADYDRVILIVDTLAANMTFPDKFLIIQNHNTMDMDGNDITIPGRVDGELSLTGSGSVLNLSGRVEGMVINRSLMTVNHTGTGSYFNNGVLTS